MKLRTVSLFFLGLSALLACGPPKAELRVGLIAPLSGTMAELVGRPAREAAELAVRQINAGGGIEADGRRYRIVLIARDGADQPNSALDAARALVNQDGVTAIVGPLLSRNALAVARLAESRQIPMISPSASHPELTARRRWVFRATFGDEFQARALASFARGELAAKSAAVLYDKASSYNRSFAEIFRRAFEEAGGQMVAVETYTTGQLDFSRALEPVRDAAPDVLVLPNYPDEVPRQARQARELGIEAILLGGDSWNMRLFLQQSDFEGSYVALEWHLDVENEASRRFVGAYEEFYGRSPESMAALTWDAFGLLFEAIAGRGSTDGAEIRQGLANIGSFQGATGTIAFNGRGEPVKDVLLLHIVGGEARLHRRIRAVPASP